MLAIMDYLNKARNQAVGLAKTFGNNIQQSNTDIANLNQAIMQKGMNGLSPEEKQLFQTYYMNPVMGMTSSPTTPELAKQLTRMPLSNVDRNIMGQFGATNQPQGQVGYNAQRILEGLGGDPTMSNKSLVNFFDRVVKLADQMGIRPLQEFSVPRIDLGR